MILVFEVPSTENVHQFWAEHETESFLNNFPRSAYEFKAVIFEEHLHCFIAIIYAISLDVLTETLLQLVRVRPYQICSQPFIYKLHSSL